MSEELHLSRGWCGFCVFWDLSVCGLTFSLPEFRFSFWMVIFSYCSFTKKTFFYHQETSWVAGKVSFHWVFFEFCRRYLFLIQLLIGSGRWYEMVCLADFYYGGNWGVLQFFGMLVVQLSFFSKSRFHFGLRYSGGCWFFVNIYVDRWCCCNCHGGIKYM